jgi:hypothetical protein
MLQFGAHNAFVSVQPAFRYCHYHDGTQNITFDLLVCRNPIPLHIALTNCFRNAYLGTDPTKNNNCSTLGPTLVPVPEQLDY